MHSSLIENGAVVNPAELVAPAVGQIGLSANVSVHFLEREGILFDVAAQRLYAANTSAIFIWCCLEEGLTQHQVLCRLQAAFGISRENAVAYLEAALKDWQHLGLIFMPGDVVAPLNHSDVSQEQLGEPLIPQVPIVTERIYRLLDVTFRFGFSAEGLAKEADAILAPLAAIEPSQRCIRLDLVPSEDGGYLIVKDGRLYNGCPRSDQIVPLIKTCMAEIALRESGDFAAIHAAAVGRQESCVLLPGISGSGKSTLTAALVASGLQLLGDDTVVLDAETLAARPVPFGICVKDGAWPLLSSRFPDLETLPIHNRLDGKRVRYLVASEQGSWAQPDARFNVQDIAFIQRVEGKPAALIPIPRFEALVRLTTEFCLLADRLDDKKIADLIAWIGERDCYELRYSGLEDAVRLVRSLLA